MRPIYRQKQQPEFEPPTVMVLGISGFVYKRFYEALKDKGLHNWKEEYERLNILACINKIKMEVGLFAHYRILPGGQTPPSLKQFLNIKR